MTSTVVLGTATPGGGFPLYGGAFALVGAVMLFGLLNKTVLEVNVVPDRNPLFVQVSGGGIRNGFTVRILNKKHGAHRFDIAVTGQNLFQDRHVEFEHNPGPIVAITRAVVASATWRR